MTIQVTAVLRRLVRGVAWMRAPAPARRVMRPGAPRSAGCASAYDARIGDEGNTVAYTPILGTTFALVAEQAPPRDELLPLLRRGLLLVGVALTATLAWLRRGRTSRDPDTGRARSRS